MRFITNEFYRILRNALPSPAKKTEKNFHFSSIYFRSEKPGNHGGCSVLVKGRPSRSQSTLPTAGSESLEHFFREIDNRNVIMMHFLDLNFPRSKRTSDYFFRNKDLVFFCGRKMELNWEKRNKNGHLFAFPQSLADEQKQR